MVDRRNVRVDVSLEATAAQELELYALRRFGADRVHVALVMPGAIAPATIFGSPCEVTLGPLVAFCKRTLRGELVIIPEEHLASWRRAGKVCRECVLVAHHAAEQLSTARSSPT